MLSVPSIYLSVYGSEAPRDTIGHFDQRERAAARATAMSHLTMHSTRTVHRCLTTLAYLATPFLYQFVYTLLAIDSDCETRQLVGAAASFYTG